MTDKRLKPTLYEMKEWSRREVNFWYKNFTIDHGESFEWDDFPEFIKSFAFHIALEYKVCDHDIYIIKNMMEEYAKEVLKSHYI
jgi:hypothetical protein